MLVKQLIYDVNTKETIEVEVEMDFPNPRIAEIETRMQEITQELSASDWKTIKYMEGGLSEEDYIVHKADRARLRDEYNTLEEEKLSLI